MRANHAAKLPLLTHRGRVSGKQYDMPIMTAACPGVFVFALTYGPEVDWLKNINAAGWGKLKWHGVEYELSKPVQISTAEGQRSFSGFKGNILRLFNIQDFIQVTAEANSKVSRPLWKIEHLLLDVGPVV